MKTYSIATLLVAALCSFSVMGQNLKIANQSPCDQVVQVIFTTDYNCGTQVSIQGQVIPAGSDHLFSAPLGSVATTVNVFDQGGFLNLLGSITLCNPAVTKDSWIDRDCGARGSKVEMSFVPAVISKGIIPGAVLIQ